MSTIQVPIPVVTPETLTNQKREFRTTVVEGHLDTKMLVFFLDDIGIASIFPLSSWRLCFIVTKEKK